MVLVPNACSPEVSAPSKGSQIELPLQIRQATEDYLQTRRGIILRHRCRRGGRSRIRPVALFLIRLSRSWLAR